MLGRSVNVLGKLNIALDAMSLLGVNPLWTPGSGVGLRVQRKTQVSAPPAIQTCGVREVQPAKLHISDYEMLLSAKDNSCSFLSSYCFQPTFIIYYNYYIAMEAKF